MKRVYVVQMVSTRTEGSIREVRVNDLYMFACHQASALHTVSTTLVAPIQYASHGFSLGRSSSPGLRRVWFRSIIVNFTSHGVQSGEILRSICVRERMIQSAIIFNAIIS